MTDDAPDTAFLADQIRWAMGRGLPPQAAEDVVFGAWQKARDAFDPGRGSFHGLIRTIVGRDCAQWWRDRAREGQAHASLRLVQEPPDGASDEAAAALQDHLLAALEPRERVVFDAWALQRQLGKGRIAAADVARSIGMSPAGFEGAKKALKSRLRALLEDAGALPHELFRGGSDAG